MGTLSLESSHGNEFLTSFYNFLVRVMRADPEPEEVVTLTARKSAVIAADAHGPVTSCGLEVQRWVMRGLNKECELLPGLVLDERT